MPFHGHTKHDFGLAGLLTYPIRCAFPVGPAHQWQKIATVFGEIQQRVCSGFSPDSLIQNRRKDTPLFSSRQHFFAFFAGGYPCKKRTGNKWFAPCPDETCVQCIVLSNHVRHNEFVTLAVHIDDFNAVIILEMLAQLGDIDIHASGIEVIVVDPNGLQRIVAL